MKTRVHVYPFHDQWIVEEMTDFQAFLNDWKLGGLKVALLNLWTLLTGRYPVQNDKIIPFGRYGQ